MKIDIKVAQLLCSRLCHDLVGVSSAINAGLDLLSGDPETEGNFFDLVNDSAIQVSNRLSFFRVAFGLAEGRNGTIRIGEAIDLCEAFVNKEKVSLEWSDFFSREHGSALAPPIAKILFNLILISEKCLPRGGKIFLHLAKLDTRHGLAAEVVGKGAIFPQEYKLALSQDCRLEDLDPRNIPMYFAQCLANKAGGKIAVETKEGSKSINFAVVLPVS